MIVFLTLSRIFSYFIGNSFKLNIIIEEEAWKIFCEILLNEYFDNNEEGYLLKSEILKNIISLIKEQNSTCFT